MGRWKDDAMVEGDKRGGEGGDATLAIAAAAAATGEETSAKRTRTSAID